jgi:hypothetical protein
MRLNAGRLLPLIFLTVSEFFLLGTARAQTKIERSSTTVLSMASPKGRANVTIHTAIFDRSCTCPSLMARILTEVNVKEISVIEQMEISVGGKSIVVPSSAYDELFDPHEATLSFENGGFVLRILGADGAYAYFTRTFFDGAGTHRVLSYDGESPDKPIGDMRYVSVAGNDVTR